MTTVGDAIGVLNEKHMHPNGFHLFFVRDALIDDDCGDPDPYLNLMRQTFDWRYGDKPDKEHYTVTLSAADMEYIGRAMEVYNEAVCTRYVNPELNGIVKKIGECKEEVSADE